MKKIFSTLLLAFSCITAWSQSGNNDSLVAGACGYTPQWIAAANNKYYSTIGAATIPISGPTPTVQFVPQDSFPADSIVRCGKFRLYYEDFLHTATPAGFLHPLYGADAQNTMCAVLTYIQSVFDIRDTIDLFVEQSYTSVIHPAPALYTALAAAGPYFVPNTYGVSPGIYSGNFFTHATTGVDPDTNNYDAHIIVNFDQYWIPAYSSYWPISYQADASQPSSRCQFDLFTVLLHEVMHSMGWVSAIKEDNLSSNFNAISGSGNDSCFTLLDWRFFYYGNILTPSTFASNKLVIGTTSSPYINPVVNTHTQPLNSDSIWLYSNGAPNNQAVYAGVVNASFNQVRSSYMSHLNYNILSFDGMNQFSPGFRPQYVIGPIVPQDERKRTFTLQEIRGLLFLGYSLNPSFAPLSSINGIDRNDSLLNNQPAYRTDLTHRVANSGDWNYDEHILPNDSLANNNSPTNLTASQVTLNLTSDTTFRDNDGDPITIMPNTLFGIRGVSLNGDDHGRLQIDSTNTQITYTPAPGFWGRAQFGFYLWDGHERGAFEIYTIEVLRGSYSPPFGSEEVIYGNFEDGTEIYQDTGNTTVQNHPQYWGMYEGVAFQGNNSGGGHPHSYASNWWVPGVGGFIVGHSAWHCGNPATVQPFEQFGAVNIDWNRYYGFHPPSKADTALNDRYAKLGPAVSGHSASIYSALNRTVHGCSTHIFSFDVNYSRTLHSVGDTITVILNFISDPRTNPATSVSYESHQVRFVLDTIRADYWQHVSDTITYCSTNPADFIGVSATAFSSGGIYHQPLIDNISLHDIVPPSLAIVADNDSNTVNPGSNVTVCLGDTVKLAALTRHGKCGVTYQWMPGSFTTTSITVVPSSTVTYTLTVFDCSDTTTSTFTINVVTPPTANAGVDGTVCPGQSIVIGETQQNGLSLLWSPSATLNNDTLQNPLATPSTTTHYILTVTDGNGCVGKDTVKVTVLPNGSALCFTCLVPNGNFETYSTCPNGIGELNLAETWSWANLGSSDYDNLCAPTATGVNVPNNTIFGPTPSMTSPAGLNGYAGIRVFGTSGNNNREYLETRLNCKLDSGQEYIVGFYARSAPNCINGYNNIGMHLSPSPTYAANSVLPISVTPQINRTNPLVNSDGWVWIGDSSYIGNNERYITIGNFFDDSSTSSGVSNTGGTLTFGYDFVDNVIAVPKPPTITTLSPTICAGNCIWLAATGAAGYSWTDGVNTYTGDSISVCPTVTTTYTVTPILSCALACPAAATVTVTVNPAPTVDAGANIIACGGNFLQFTPSATGTGTISYSWNPATGLSSTTIANPYISSYDANPITYTLSITDSNGCSASDTISISPGANCCTALRYLPDTLNSVTIGPGSYALNQNLTILGTCTFNNADIKIASGVQISVESGATEYVTNQSHLHACDSLWQGFRQQAGSTLVIDQNSLIEDAYRAVRTDSTGSSSVTILDEAIFNKNHVSVDIQPFAGVVPVVIENCRFTSRKLPPSPTVSLLTPAYLTSLPAVNLINPLSTERPFTAIDVTDVGSVTVGAAAFGRMNVYDNLDHGIFGSNSDVDSQNNWYQNMDGTNIVCPGPPNPCPPKPGIAILLTDPTLDVNDPSTFNRVNVGGDGLSRNYFVDCYEAVDVTGYVYHTVLNDSIISSKTVDGLSAVNLNGGTGVFLRTRLSQQMDVRENLVTNQAVGIHVILSAGGLPNSTIQINTNEVVALPTDSTYTTDGIFVEGVLGVYFNTGDYLFIDTNKVMNAQTCIWVRNLLKGTTRIENNPELFIKPNANNNAGPNQAGVLVQNSNEVTVIGNPNIHSTGTTYNNSNHRNVRGIYLIKTGSATVSCNVVHNTGQSIVFEGSCNASVFKLNDMSNAYDGYVLRNSAIIGPQGDTTHPIDNRWLGGFVHSETFTDNTANCNLSSPIWVRNSSPYLPTTNATNLSPITDVYIPHLVAPYFVAATCPETTGGGGDAGLMKVRQDIAQDQIVYATYPDENKVANQIRLLNELGDNPSLMTGDTILQNFSNENQSSNLGLIKDATDATATGDVTTAANATSAINPLTASESNQQQFNDLFLNTLMLGQDQLTPQQIDELMAIASQCPDAGGEAVYEARAMLNWVLHSSLYFTDSCYSSERVAHNDVQQSENNLATVFPNPNTGKITVSYKMDKVNAARFEVWDGTGRVLLSVPLEPGAGQKEIELAGIANGAYIYKLVADDFAIKNGVLIISR